LTIPFAFQGNEGSPVPPPPHAFPCSFKRHMTRAIDLALSLLSHSPSLPSSWRWHIKSLCLPPGRSLCPPFSRLPFRFWIFPPFCGRRPNPAPTSPPKFFFCPLAPELFQQSFRFTPPPDAFPFPWPAMRLPNFFLFFPFFATPPLFSMSDFFVCCAVATAAVVAPSMLDCCTRALPFELYLFGFTSLYDLSGALPHVPHIVFLFPVLFPPPGIDANGPWRPGSQGRLDLTLGRPNFPLQVPL